MHEYEMDAIAKAFDSVPEDEQTSNMAAAFMCLVFDLGEHRRDQARRKQNRDEANLPLQMLEYVVNGLNAPGLTAGGHCGDRDDMWHEYHSDHLSAICDLAVVEGLGSDAPFDAIQLMEQAVALLTPAEDDTRFDS